eukprot:637047-Heterocapsa_arctica.AAC.1
MKEVDKGTMGPAISEDALDAKYNGLWKLCRRFGLRQGVDEHGRAKYRAIDDHSEGGTNAAALRMQRIHMSS